MNKSTIEAVQPEPQPNSEQKADKKYVCPSIANAPVGCCTSQEEKVSRGKVTVGFGTAEQREMEIIDFVQAEFKDHRLISISEIEDGSLVTVVENPKSSGRNTQATIWLSKESFVGILSTAFIYFSAKGQDLGKLMQEAVERNKIDYTFSDNLTALDEK